MSRQNVTAIGVLVLCAFVAGHCSGCGGGAVREHLRVAGVLTVATQGAAEAVSVATTADAEATCPTAEEACMTTLRLRWAPADTAIASARAAILIYIESIALADESGDLSLLLPALGRVISAVEPVVLRLGDAGVAHAEAVAAALRLASALLSAGGL